MNSGRDTTSWIVVLMAGFSLISMICLLQTDKIVHGDLYNYGLRFSYDWATPYWTLTKTAFAMGWLNIIVAFMIQLNNVRFKRREVEQLVTEFRKEISKTEKNPEENKKEQKDKEAKPAEPPKEAPETAPKQPMTQEKKEGQQPVPEDQPNQETESQKPKETPEQKPQALEIDPIETPILAGL